MELANKNTRALRYDSLASVLTNLDKHATVLPGKFKPDRISSVDSTELAELRANVASLKAENQRLVESLTDELNQLAERVTELEDRARRPWWRRALDPIGEEREPAAPTGAQAGRTTHSGLKSAFCDEYHNGHEKNVLLSEVEE